MDSPQTFKMEMLNEVKSMGDTRINGMSWRQSEQKMPHKLKKLLDGRDDDAIIKYLETNKENFTVIITSYIFLLMG